MMRYGDVLVYIFLAKPLQDVITVHKLQNDEIPINTKSWLVKTINEKPNMVYNSAQIEVDNQTKKLERATWEMEDWGEGLELNNEDSVID